MYEKKRRKRAKREQEREKAETNKKRSKIEEKKESTESPSCHNNYMQNHLYVDKNKSPKILEECNILNNLTRKKREHPRTELGFNSYKK